MKTYFGTTFSPNPALFGWLKIPLKFYLNALSPCIPIMKIAIIASGLDHTFPAINSICKTSGPVQNNIKNIIKITRLASDTPLNKGRWSPPT